MRPNTKEIHILSDGDLASTQLGISSSSFCGSASLPRQCEFLASYSVVQEPLTPPPTAVSLVFKSRYPLFEVLCPRVLLANGHEFLPLLEKDSAPDLLQPYRQRKLNSPYRIATTTNFCYTALADRPISHCPSRSRDRVPVHPFQERRHL